MRVILVVFITVFCFTPSWAFDAQLAKNYERFFSDYKDEKLLTALGMVTPAELVEAITNKEDVLILDIRTPLETGIVGITFKNTLTIPINEVFKQENLEKIPGGKKIVIVCQRGVRAAAIAVALRNIGFNNVTILRGGMAALVDYVCPDNLY